MYYAKMILCSFFIVFLFSNLTYAKAETEQPASQEYSLKLDLGDNGVSMLSRSGDVLQKINSKVFPAYVKQSKLDGTIPIYAWATVEILILFFGLFLFFLSNDTEGSGAILIICFLIILIILLFFIPEWYKKMTNPEFYAMQQIITDLSKIR